jgi:hypothetical protein
MSEDVQSKTEIDTIESNRINPSCSTFFLVWMISLAYLCNLKCSYFINMILCQRNLTRMIRPRGVSVIERKLIQALWPRDVILTHLINPKIMPVTLRVDNKIIWGDSCKTLLTGNEPKKIIQSEFIKINIYYAVYFNNENNAL